jgi:hypothetical protein
VKLEIGQFLKHHGMKKCVTFVTLRNLKMKSTLLDCPTYTEIRSDFQNICHSTNIPNLLTQQNYGDLGKLLLMVQKQNSKESQVLTYPLKVIIIINYALNPLRNCWIWIFEWLSPYNFQDSIYAFRNAI